MHKNQSLLAALFLALTASPTCIAGESAAVPPCSVTPKPVRAEPPPWRETRGAPSEGRLLIAITIDTKGQVHDPAIIESSDVWFNEMTLKAVLLWTFHPSKSECRAQVPIVYK